MLKRILKKFESLHPVGRKQWLVLAGGVMVLILAVISCSTVHRAVVQLPNVPGATYVGSDQCSMCHYNISQDFVTADHARLMARGTNALNAGCESCHGPCSQHVESGGGVLPPYTFTSGRSETSSYGARLAVEPARSEELVCYRCHADVRARFQLPFHHPVPEGHMSCTDCHNPHKGSIMLGGGTSELSINQMCLRCHPAERGPFVFAHEAMHEGCITCHNPHGSINAKLLKVRDANLCLRCHFQQIQQTVTGTAVYIGGVNHTYMLQQGTCWTAGCHQAVHGSQVSPSLRF